MIPNYNLGIIVLAGLAEKYNLPWISCKILLQAIDDVVNRYLNSVKIAF